MEAGYRNVVLETDSMQLYWALTKGYNVASSLGTVVRDILGLSRACQACEFSYVRRSGNQVAHTLAEISKSYGGMRVWLEDFPNAIEQYVIADCVSMNE
ncbi:E3 ubiquitin-protein ligase LAP [Bienertia sinuspersici]